MSDQEDSQFTGKYENSGRAARWLIDRFYSAVVDMLAPTSAGTSLLEVGCGAGYSTQYLHTALDPTQQLRATDIGDSLLQAARQRNPGVEFFKSSIYNLPLPDKSIDTVVMLEVLEHLTDPDAALAELARIARHRVVISTPREPLWCAMNFARGKYLAHLGNTPGHIQHWSSNGLKRQANRHFKVECTRTPVPWTILRLRPR